MSLCIMDNWTWFAILWVSCLCSYILLNKVCSFCLSLIHTCLMFCNNDRQTHTCTHTTHIHTLLPFTRVHVQPCICSIIINPWCNILSVVYKGTHTHSYHSFICMYLSLIKAPFSGCPSCSGPIWKTSWLPSVSLSTLPLVEPRRLLGPFIRSTWIWGSSGY